MNLDDLDHYLRNSLGDDDYAAYSAPLEDMAMKLHYMEEAVRKALKDLETTLNRGV